MMKIDYNFADNNKNNIFLSISFIDTTILCSEKLFNRKKFVISLMASTNYRLCTLVLFFYIGYIIKKYYYY